MPLPRYSPGPVDYWLAEAATQFINGAIAGFKTAATGGLVIGGGVAASELGNKVSPVMNALLAIGSIAATCGGAGLTRVVDWHKTNEFPNPWPRPKE